MCDTRNFLPRLQSMVLLDEILVVQKRIACCMGVHSQIFRCVGGHKQVSLLLLLFDS